MTCPSDSTVRSNIAYAMAMSGGDPDCLKLSEFYPVASHLLEKVKAGEVRGLQYEGHVDEILRISVSARDDQVIATLETIEHIRKLLRRSLDSGKKVSNGTWQPADLHTLQEAEEYLERYSLNLHAALHVQQNFRNMYTAAQKLLQECREALPDHHELTGKIDTFFKAARP